MDIMSMKSSRRKQSKPIRVSYNDDTEKLLQPQAGDEEFVTFGTLDTRDPEHEKENKCDESFSSAEHSNDCDTKNENLSPINLTVRVPHETGFPTAYHRLASEFTMKSFVPNGHNKSVVEDENNIETIDKDVVDAEHGDKNDGEKPKDRSGIFHPDAYCELCDKEFCNKYFLKTHKANKHGIYDNSTSPFAPSVNPLPPSMVLPQDYSSLPFKLNMDFPLPPLKPNASSATPSTPQLTPTNLPALSPQRQSPPDSQPLNQMPNKQPLSPMPLSKPKPLDSSANSTSSSEGGDGRSSSIQDMEDFCEICQKHFCNKYYLKKHKNDVHGITPLDTPVCIGKRGGRPPNSELKLPATPVTSDSLLIPHSLASLPGLPNMPGMMVINPFLPPMLIPGSLMNQHGYMPPRPPHLPLASPHIYSSSSSMPVTSISDSKSVLSGSSNTIATSSSPSDFLSVEALRSLGISIADGINPGETLRRMGLVSPDGQITSDVLRGIGILGGETFCDICRKEFCNTYFLKIHKANKHGLYIDEHSLSPTMATVMNLGLPTKPSDMSTNTIDNMNRSTEKEHVRDTYDGNKPDSSPKAAITPVSQPSDFMTHCNMCSQEFASKYAYRIHRIQAHGMVNEPFNEAELAEEAFRLHSGELPKHVSIKIAEEISAMERNSEAAGFSTMFGSMVAAKLADRVTCEICNKELCNKYFLKVHKMKVHGIDIAAQERSPKPGTAMLPLERSQSKVDFNPSSGRLDFSCFSRAFNLKPESKESSQSRPASTASIDNQLNQSVERPSNEELVKMGMDPEAYCEICKKEFCSKYFLRTHKQNIHGIPPKTDSQENSLSKSFSMSMAPHLALSTPLLPSSFMSNINRSSLFMQTKPMNLSSNNNMSSTNSALSTQLKTVSSQNSNNKWKEPQNSARVTCELCNKELCNKYFLRTHKINKHGILLEDLSPSTSQNMSPNTSDIETSSNSSVPADMSHEKHMQSPKLNIENSKLFTNKIEDNSYSDVLNLKIKTENDGYLNCFDAEICHLCSRRFKSSKWLKQHILKDHAGLTSLSPTMEKVLNIGGHYGPLELKTCSICSIVFPSEMSMQLHMIQEHNAQVTIKTDSQSPPMKNFGSRCQFSGISKRFGLKPRFTFSIKQKSYCCSVCNYKSKWLSNILSHEGSVHGINHNLKKLRCNSCHKVFRKERSLRNHMMKVHGDYSVSEVSFSKQYRCTKCWQSFSTALECHLHIRHDHIRRHSFHVNNHCEDVRHRCSKCSFSTRFKKQFQRHALRCHNYPTHLQQTGFSELEKSNSGKITYNLKNIHAKARSSSAHYTMQTFEIKQCSDDGVFVTSVVEMPVLKKLKSSTSVSFVVTPLEEP